MRGTAHDRGRWPDVLGGAEVPFEVLLLLPLSLIGVLTATGPAPFKIASRTDVEEVDSGSGEEVLGRIESPSSNQPMSEAIRLMVPGLVRRNRLLVKHVIAICAKWVDQ